MGRVIGLYRHRQRGVFCPCQVLTVTERGVAGSCKETGFVIADAGALSGSRAAGGLCAARFCPDAKTEGLAYGLLAPGVLLQAGGALCRVERIGKSCMAGCPVAESGRICPLRGACAVLSVVIPGQVCVSDSIGLFKQS